MIKDILKDFVVGLMVVVPCGLLLYLILLIPREIEIVLSVILIILAVWLIGSIVRGS